MNTLKKIALLFMTIFISVVASCSKDDTQAPLENGMANTTVSASANLFAGRSSFLEIESFLINIKEIELEFDDDNSGSNSNGNNFSDLELEGPFELFFTPQGTTVPVANLQIPLGDYEELEFVISRGKDSSSALYDKSVLLSGNIDGVPFLFWYTFWEKLEIDFENSQTDITIQNNGEEIVFNFDLSVLFNNAFVDLTSAQDGNGDGIIEISKNDPDGNNDLADRIKDLIKENIDLLDD
ncbi:DUF4382 domain-containing protein [Aureitalea sp. L0-47]|uniref:DUF4382 domain-containing protein n=1 Tax=Aureitalea sp. L0-47 TaxID=2816962 RepID=UPI0022385E29|nr:DUF4382 domain-containing protein [Aureitalea sp. L0-47]MCW5519067.1 DUF4382 domain-containing protein [Aureitalea sp. L0-47]